MDAVDFPFLYHMMREVQRNPGSPEWPPEVGDPVPLLDLITDVLASTDLFIAYITKTRTLIYPLTQSFKAQGLSLASVSILRGVDGAVLDQLLERPLSRWTRGELEAIGLPLQQLLINPVVLGQLHNEIQEWDPIAWVPAVRKQAELTIQRMNRQKRLETGDPFATAVPDISYESIWRSVFGEPPPATPQKSSQQLAGSMRSAPSDRAITTTPEETAKIEVILKSIIAQASPTGAGGDDSAIIDQAENALTTEVSLNIRVLDRSTIEVSASGACRMGLGCVLACTWSGIGNEEIARGEIAELGEPLVLRASGKIGFASGQTLRFVFTKREPHPYRVEGQVTLSND